MDLQVSSSIYSLFKTSLSDLSGCGKSSIPSFLAKKFGYNLLQSNIASLMKGSIGGTEEELVKLFQKAKKQSPCFLVLDELTSIFRKDEHSENSGDSSAERTIFSTLLSCFDDVNSWNLYNSTHKGSEDHSRERNIIVIGITREPWLLPSRLMSYGRFQRSIFVDILSDTGRENFLREEICSMTPRGGNEELLMELVKLTDGFSGVDLQYLMKKLANCLQKAEKNGNHNQLEKNMIEMTRGRTPSISKSMREKFKTWKR